MIPTTLGYVTTGQNAAGYETAARQGPPSSLLTASAAFDRAIELAHHVNALAERLCGPSLTGQTGEPSAPARAGVFGAVDAAANNVLHELDAAFIAINRIENDLP